MRLPSGGALLVEGSGAGTPALFLSAGKAGADAWRPQREALATSFRLFVWEPRVRAALDDYYRDAKEALAEVVDATRKPAVVVGESLGGLLALALAADVGGGVAGLFLIDPVYATGREPLLRVRPRVGGLPLGGFKLRDFAKDVADPTFLLERSRAGRGLRNRRLVRILRERLGDQFTYESIPGGPAGKVNARLRTFLEEMDR